MRGVSNKHCLLTFFIHSVVAGLSNGYFNLSRILSEEGSSLHNAYYQDNSIIRTIAIGKKFNVLTVVLNPNMNKTQLNFTIEAGPVNRTKEVSRPGSNV